MKYFVGIAHLYIFNAKKNKNSMKITELVVIENEKRN